jgi:cysteine desulfurase
VTDARTYLDYNASAPLREAARAALVAALTECGNPSSVHAEGRRARTIVEAARGEVARLVGAAPADVVFTSGASEANATVIAADWPVIVVSAIEHDSIHASARAAEARGSRLIVVAVGRNGVADLAAVERAAVDAAALAAGRPWLFALQLANNETGVIQPVAEAVAIAQARGALALCDAVQAAGRLPLEMPALGVDALVLSSHKIGGPKGAGALVLRPGATLTPLIAGGGQERGRRAGTENVAAIAGFGAAAREAAVEAHDMSRIESLRNRLEAEVGRLTPAAEIVGAGAPRLANTSSLALPGLSAETLVIRLDLAGLAVSAGAACSSGKVKASRVLAAMGVPEPTARAVIRVSLGHATTEADIERFVAAWRVIATSGVTNSSAGASASRQLERAS